MSELVIRVPRRLQSVNGGLRAMWHVRHQQTKAWEQDIWALTQGMEGVKALPRTRRRVVITREVPSTRDFIRDTDNLFAACKPLCDALKRLDYLCDDAAQFLDLAKPRQVISADGQHWTEIRISEALP